MHAVSDDLRYNNTHILQESLQDTECTCDAVTLVMQYFGSGIRCRKL